MKTKCYEVKLPGRKNYMKRGWGTPYTYDVYVFKDKQELIDKVKEFRKSEGVESGDPSVVSDGSNDEDAAAITLRRKRAKGRCLGAVLFNYKDFDLSTVVHEMFHAAVGWAMRTKPDNEEDVAYMVDALVWAFYKETKLPINFKRYRK